MGSRAPPPTIDLRLLKSVVREKWAHGAVRSYVDALDDVMGRREGLARLEALVALIRAESAPR